MSSLWAPDDPWADDPGSGGRSITRITRRGIFDYLRTCGFAWYGWLDELAFLGRLYELDDLPSLDHRFKTATQDIRQHRINNADWGDDWIFTDPRLRLASGPDDVLLEFLAQVVHPVVREDAAQSEEIVSAFNGLLESNGWKLTVSGQRSGRPIYSPTQLGRGVDVAVQFAHEMAARVDLAYLSRQVTRMQEAVQSDPELAIGTAKELIETVCKTILDGLGVGFAKNDDVPVLIKSTMKALGLGRDDIDPNARAADTIKRVLSNLGQIAQGTAELRNAYGTGHGRSGSTVSGLHPRHARLVVGASATLASFLYETYEAIAT